MTCIFALSYSDFGYLLSENSWDIKRQIKEDSLGFGIFKDEYHFNQFQIIRRYSLVKNIFEDSDEPTEGELPSDITELELSYNHQRLVIIDSLSLEKLKDNQSLIDFNLLKSTDPAIEKYQIDPQILVEDIRILVN